MTMYVFKVGETPRKKAQPEKQLIIACFSPTCTQLTSF